MSGKSLFQKDNDDHAIAVAKGCLIQALVLLVLLLCALVAKTIVFG